MKHVSKVDVIFCYECKFQTPGYILGVFDGGGGGAKLRLIDEHGNKKPKSYWRNFWKPWISNKFWLILKVLHVNVGILFWALLFLTFVTHICYFCKLMLNFDLNKLVVSSIDKNKIIHILKTKLGLEIAPHVLEVHWP